MRFPSELTVAVELPMTIGAWLRDVGAAAALGMSACVDVPAKLTTAPFSLEDWSLATS